MVCQLDVNISELGALRKTRNIQQLLKMLEPRMEP